MSTKRPHKNLQRFIPAASAALAAVALVVWFNMDSRRQIELRVPGVDRPEGYVAGSELAGNPVPLGRMIRGAGKPAELSGAWPRFRGTNFNALCTDGVALAREWPSGRPPVHWSLDVGEGYAGAAIWQGRVFLMDYDKPNKEDALRCLSIADGTEIWRYALFGTGEMVAVDFLGRLVWSRNFGQPVNMYGHSSSLLTWRNRVIAQLDQGNEVSGLSRLYALDALTGEVVWEQRRPVGASWATAILIQAAGGEQLVVPGEPWLMSHDPDTGRELWRVGQFGHDLAPSPMFAGGLVFAISVSEKIAAVRPDGSGDVTETHVAWEQGGSIPDIASPVSNGELVFLLVSYDGVTCLYAATGKVVWEHELDGELQASPVVAGDRLYAISINGEAFVLEAGREPRELGRGQFGERVFASPAFVGDRIIVRGETNLICLGVSAETRKEVADER